MVAAFFQTFCFSRRARAFSAAVVRCSGVMALSRARICFRKGAFSIFEPLVMSVEKSPPVVSGLSAKEGHNIVLSLEHKIARNLRNFWASCPGFRFEERT